MANTQNKPECMPKGGGGQLVRLGGPVGLEAVFYIDHAWGIAELAKAGTPGTKHTQIATSTPLYGVLTSVDVLGATSDGPCLYLPRPSMSGYTFVRDAHPSQQKTRALLSPLI